MKRIVIALSIIAVGLLGAAIGYHWSNYTSSEPPAVKVLFSGGGVHVRRMNMIPSKEEYVYSLVARIDSCGVNNSPDTPAGGSKPLDPGAQDHAAIHTKSITEKILQRHLYANRGDLTPKDLVVAVQLRPTTTREVGPGGNVSPWHWDDPLLNIRWYLYVLEEDMWWAFSQASLSIPTEACQVYFDGPPVSGCKWENNELVILELSMRNMEEHCLMNVDIVLIRNLLRS